MAYNPTQSRNAKGAPMAGAWSADNRRGMAPTQSTEFVDVLADEGYITVPNYNDGNPDWLERDYGRTNASRDDFQFSITPESITVAGHAHGVPDELLRKVGIRVSGDTAFFELDHGAASLDEADRAVVGDWRYTALQRLQRSYEGPLAAEGRDGLVDFLERSRDYDPSAPSVFQDDHRLAGYTPPRASDFLDHYREHFPDRVGLGDLQHIYPEATEWWTSMSSERQHQILDDYAQVDEAGPRAIGLAHDAQSFDIADAVIERGNSPVQHPGVGGRVSDGYMGGIERTGSEYEAGKSLSDAEVSRTIKKNLLSATKSGHLPAAAKVSVRRTAGNFRVQVSGLPRDLIMERRGAGDPAWDDVRNRYSDYASEVRSRVENIAGAFGHSDVNSQVDYFNSYRSASVSFD